DLADQVWYDGHTMNKSDLPRIDFNRPWIINLTYVGTLPYGFTLSGTAKYRSGYRVLEDTKEDIVLPDSETLPIYDEVKKGGGVVLSCLIQWEKSIFLNQSMIFSIEINNLMNKKSPVANSDDYEIGRQVWAGMEYRF
ncbi:MAG: hypothetical protein R2864_14880, partial [Syntrophotaleaceae bacterium]